LPRLGSRPCSTSTGKSCARWRRAELLTAQQACERVPVLRPEMVIGAVYEPGAADMDVHAIHQGYLRGMRQAGGKLVCDAEVRAITRHGDVWRVEADKPSTKRRSC
jgi:glycine/D-amino acid oxidase-like deaminating enzyme